MSKRFKAIVKNVKNFSKRLSYRAKFTYTKYYEKLPIDENSILIQSYNGSSISGNPYYLLKELCENEKYSNYKKYVVSGVNNVDTIQNIVNKHEFKNTEVLVFNSKKYSKIIATAKYLINNSTFPTYFIKKEGQVYINTWHGTPLKTLGKSIKAAPHEIGNTQRNFMMADYLIYPNKFTYEVMKRDYMLDNIFNGEYVLTGYPRNEIFYDLESRKNIREKLHLENKKVIVYMPTWKGTLDTKNVDEQIEYTKNAVEEMENKLSDDYVVYVKLHNYVTKTLELDNMKRIRLFPSEYETYEFLNIADCLVTDYSSVFFDFMNTKKKIVLFSYDYKEYMEQRGMYIDYKSLPYPITHTIDDLIEEIKDVNNYSDYTSSMNEYIEYDSENASKYLCEYVFDNKLSGNMEIIEGKSLKNNKANVLLYAGNLSKNGITTAFKGILDKAEEKNDKNYYVTFYKNAVKHNLDNVRELVDKNYNYIVIQGARDLTYIEAICQFLYFRCNIKTKFITKKLEKSFKREVTRLYPNMNFESIIHFSGYESKFMHLMAQVDAKKLIWAHNNMYKEEKSKQNFHKKSLEYIYSVADKIVVVRDTMKEELSSYLKPKDKDKVVLVHNVNDIEGIKLKATKEIEFQENTFCNVSIEKLEKVLNNKKYTKFINIARFSKEKGIDNLIRAFKKYLEKDKKAYLIIIGGYGVEFKKILSMVQNEDGSTIIDNIIIIKSISNPYPILNKCDVFVLSSLYEGLPMTIMEALILNKKIISTDITGPKEFLEQGYGYLVDCSVDGLLQGFNDYKDGKIKDLKAFDAEEFNEVAIREFYEAMEK